MDYDPAMGVFVWKVSPGPRTSIGSRVGHKGPGGRPVVEIDGKLHYLARLAWFYVHGVWPNGVVLPENGEKTDIRIANLMEQSHSELRISGGLNSLNTSGIKGVSWKKSKAKWVAMITRDSVQYYLGEFSTKEAAAEAYQAAAAGGPLPDRGRTKDPDWQNSRRQRSAPWKAIKENPSIVGWETLEQFIADLGEPPTRDHVLMRQRYDDPLGPGNAMWRLPWAKRDGHETEPTKSYNLMQFEISVGEYNRLHALQEGLCAICKRPESVPFKGTIRRLAVDHDHKTGQIRGLLCAQCNNGLGRFDDDPDRLRAAADYIENGIVSLVKKDAS